MTIPVLTIDGPGGAGKGTVSRAIARQLNWHYLDSGAIYRSLALAALKQNVDLHRPELLTEIAAIMQLEFICQDTFSVWLDGEDITDQLPEESTGNAASIVAAFPEVRAALLQKQKDFQKLPGLVADGRDMGTVVFPQAQYKVFLTASPEERAKRRYKQLKEKGIDANLSKITEDIEARDQRDRERSASPMIPADDALYIDSSDLNIDQVIEQIRASMDSFLGGR